MQFGALGLSLCKLFANLSCDMVLTVDFRLWAYLQRDTVPLHRPSIMLPEMPHPAEERAPGLHSKARSATETYITRVNFALLLHDFGLAYGWKAGRISETVSATTAEQLYIRLMERSKSLQPVSIHGMSTASMVLRSVFHHPKGLLVTDPDEDDFSHDRHGHLQTFFEFGGTTHITEARFDSTAHLFGISGTAHSARQSLPRSFSELD